MFAGRLANGTEQILGQYLAVHNQCDIPSDLREAGQFAKARQLALTDLRQCQLEHKYRPIEVKILNQLRVQRTDQAYLLFTIEDPGRLARMQRRVATGAKRKLTPAALCARMASTSALTSKKSTFSAPFAQPSG